MPLLKHILYLSALNTNLSLYSATKRGSKALSMVSSDLGQQ